VGGAGSGDARVFLPLGVTAAPDGTIYVTLDETVKHFDAAGTYLGSWGSESGSVGAGDGEFWHPYDVAVAPDGVTVYVADTNNHRVQIFEAAPCANGVAAPSNRRDRFDGARASPLSRLRTRRR
jgi:DNA-binding beta-propeller fold protein YncE